MTGKVSPQEAIHIHRLLHNEAYSCVVIDGKKWPITIKTTLNYNVRQVVVFGITFEQHNPNKKSPWSSKVKQGHKITWIQFDNQWGRIVDDVIQSRCPAFDDSIIRSIVHDDDNSDYKSQEAERPKKKLKTSHNTDSDNTDTLPTLTVNNTAELKGTGSDMGIDDPPKLTKGGSGYLLDPSQVIDFSELTLGHRLGEGAFGYVCQAAFRGTDVAVKILHSQDKKAQTMFIKEAALLCKLRHPNIVQCLGACIEPPNCCILMELLANNLSKYIKKNEYRFDSFVKICLGTAQGINFLHKSKPVIIHRDLKPGNILLDESLNPKIADFGVSREKEASVATMTRIGTPLYCAPEVLNNEFYSTAVDIYSFALVMYFMITKNRPWKYDKLTPVQLMLKVAKNERPKIPATCPEHISVLIQACWSHDPNSRPTATDIINFFKSNLDPSVLKSGEVKAVTKSQEEPLKGNVKTENPAATKLIDSLDKTKALDNQLSATVVDNIAATKVLDDNLAATKVLDTLVATKLIDDMPIDGNISKTQTLGKAVCKYDLECYRTNPQHLEEYTHPLKEYAKFLNKFLENTSISKTNLRYITKYKKSKKISDENHNKVLESMGWTPKEFEDGKKTNLKRKPSQ